MIKRHCSNLEDISKNLVEYLASFLKSRNRKKEIDPDKLVPKYTCKITKKRCIANLVEPSYLRNPPSRAYIEVVNTGPIKLTEYDEDLARRCPCFFEPED